jgi:hypothetical protein
MLIASSIYLWKVTDRFPGSAADFPRVVLALIGVLALFLVLRSLIPAIELTTDGEGSGDYRAMIAPVLSIIATSGAVYLMRFVTFFPAVALLGVALFFILGVRNRAMFAISYVGMMIFTFIVFQVLLNVPLTSTRLLGG